MKLVQERSAAAVLDRGTVIIPIQKNHRAEDNPPAEKTFTPLTVDDMAWLSLASVSDSIEGANDPNKTNFAISPEYRKDLELRKQELEEILEIRPISNYTLKLIVSQIGKRTGVSVYQVGKFQRSVPIRIPCPTASLEEIPPVGPLMSEAA